LLVVDRANHRLYESYNSNYNGSVLQSICGVVWDLSRTYPASGRGEQCTSTDAAGFPVAPLLFNADEVAAGEINHAIRFILPNNRMRRNYYVHPATHAGAPSANGSAPIYGMRFRLKSSFNVASLKPAAQVVARALQKYGMLLADGGQLPLTAESDRFTTHKWAEVDFGALDLNSIRVTDFEVVDAGARIPLTYNCVRNP
jgi:serine/threonine-protein kinase